MLYKNPYDRWDSPALAVPKPRTFKHNLTGDLRSPNARNVPILSAIPHLESKFKDVSERTYFANIDLAHRYCKLPLSKESHETVSIEISVGVFSSLLLQGGYDFGNHFQAVLQENFDRIVHNVL